LQNVVFGAMYGTFWGTLYTSILTAVGGVGCYLLVAPLAPLLAAMPGISKPLAAIRRALAPAGRSTGIARPASAASRRASARRSRLSRRGSARSKAAAAQESSGNIWSYLLVLRVIPVVPYGVMNIACSILRVPLLPYAGTLALGSVAWNGVTATVGEVLIDTLQALPASVASTTLGDGLVSGGFVDAPAPGTSPLESQRLQAVAHKAQTGARAIAAHIWKPEMLFKLVVLSTLSLAPLGLKWYLKRRETQRAEADDSLDEMLDEAVELEHDCDSDIEMDAAAGADTDADTSCATTMRETRSWGPERLAAWSWDDAKESVLGRSSSLGGAAGMRHAHARQSTDMPFLDAQSELPLPLFEYDEEYEDAEDENPYDLIARLETRSPAAAAVSAA
jgi:hypothetical protein